MHLRRYRIDRSPPQADADAGHGFVRLLHRAKRAKVRLMGHSKGRDNAKKRAKRRKKNERLASAKQPSHEATARQKKNTATNTREREPRG